MDLLLTTLLDLDLQLGGKAEFCLGGGYGLYVKQRYLRQHLEIQTLRSPELIPEARTTEDLDIFLRSEVVADVGQMSRIRDALDQLDFQVVPTARNFQFAKKTAAGVVKIDLLVGPLGGFEGLIKRDARRARPKQGRGDLHARRVTEAVGIEAPSLILPVAGFLTTGMKHATTVRIPPPFTYLLMKLLAFRDRIDDEDKMFGSHHALDIYRIMGLVTRDEDADLRGMSERYCDEVPVVQARQIVAEYFRDADSLGLLRIREHPLYSTNLRLNDFSRELHSVFPAP